MYDELNDHELRQLNLMQEQFLSNPVHDDNDWQELLEDLGGFFELKVYMSMEEGSV